MQFKIDLSQPVPAELRRVLLEQVERARQGLLAEGASEKAVHEARKACKRARAVVGLMGPSIDRADRRRLDRAFRDAARHIGPVRDADVMRKTLAALGGASNPEATTVVDREARAEATVLAFDHARDLVLGHDITHLDRHALVEGLVVSWRRARGAWDDADLEHHADAFHDWRKAVKQLLYHVQLLVDLDPGVLSGLEQQLDALQESLGDRNDLHVLETTADPSDAATVAALHHKASTLEERTLALGGWVLSAPPRQLRRWLKVVTPE